MNSQHSVQAHLERRQRLRRWGLIAAGTMLLVAAAVGVKLLWTPPQVVAQDPAPRKEKAKPAKPQGPLYVARVNNQRITKDDLAKECLRRHGEEVLENLVNRQIIETHCKARGIEVTQKEVQEEIERVAKRFGMAIDQYLKLLQDERDIKPNEYAHDIIWPTLALRKLAASRLTVTQEEVTKLYEAKYGPKVHARMIACDTQEDAQRVQKLAVGQPQDFQKLAMKYSTDKYTASAGGLLQPISKHTGNPTIEKTLFGLQEGQVSGVLKVGNQWVILQCLRHYPASNVPLNKVKESLVEALREQKLRTAGHDVFGKIQEQTKVVNVINNPQLRQQYPGVAAFVNNQPVKLADLENAAIARHGRKVLDAMISHKLLEQECAKRQIQITERDLQQEIAETAHELGYEDVGKWLEKVQKEQDVSLDFYKRQVIWPTVALKRMVADKVKVEPADLQRAFEANYGPRVRLRAIFFNNQKRARDVWGMASKNLSADNFARLAKKYSVDPNSRVTGGEIPPLHRHCGNPLLEREAFALKEGELSPVIQLGDGYVVLYCEGFTNPVSVKLEEVKSELHKHVFDKKLRVAIAEEYDKIQSAATIDNILTGTVQSPDNELEKKVSTKPNAAAPKR